MKIVLLISLIIYSQAPAVAQQVFKCGNTYSDAPCAANTKPIEIKPALGYDCSKFENKYSSVCQKEKRQVYKTAVTPSIKKLSSESIHSIKNDSSWAAPYPSGASKLPPNYVGLDGNKTFQLFKSKSQSLKKNEFEKDEEFKIRIQNVDLSPLSSNVEYAFPFEIRINYDANNERYIIENIFDSKSHSTEGELVLFKITPLERDLNNYIGSNAFGVTANVTNINSTYFSIAFPLKSAFLKQLFTKSSINSDYFFSDKFPLPIDKAKDLDKKNIEALLIGEFTNVEIINNISGVAPTLSRPQGFTTIQNAVPFKPTQIIYYVKQTGEILSRKAL